MSRLRIAGIVAAFALAGCGDDSSGVAEGTVPFKSGNVEQLAPLKAQIIENVKSKAYTKKSLTEGAPAGEAKTTAETRPAASGKPDEKKP
jgi:hypothetical protein